MSGCDTCAPRTKVLLSPQLAPLFSVFAGTESVFGNYGVGGVGGGGGVCV